MNPPTPATRLPLWQVSVFSERAFGGNPAAICLVPEWPPDDLMHAVAVENNVPETGFVRLPDARDDSVVGLRWFSPVHEVDLCGHATLAAAHVVLRHLRPGDRSVRFDTRGGQLEVTVDRDLFHLTLPVHRPVPVPDPPADLVDGLRTPVVSVLHAVKNFYVVLPDERAVQTVDPDLDRLRRLHPNGVSVTAAGSDTDFVSRYFAPSYGIPEDPVSGHPHCALVPFWAHRLGRETLLGRQLSARGGDVRCVLLDQGVVVAGHITPYLTGEISVPIREQRPTGTIPRSSASDAHPVRT